MTVDLQYLTWSVALCGVLWFLYIPARISAWGLLEAVGYPESPAAVPKWAQRAQNAHANMVENLVPFAALVVVAHLTQAASAETALGAALFFWARLVHAVAYTAGIPFLRTLSFAVAWAGMVIIFVEIVT